MYFLIYYDGKAVVQQKIFRLINLKKHYTMLTKQAQSAVTCSEKIFFKFYSNFQFVHIYPSNGRDRNNSRIKQQKRKMA